MDANRDPQFTYVGGPTVLIEFGGVRVLTDPTFDPAGSKYTYGPVTLYKTMVPALGAASLGRIDAILLSHDHHLDNLDHAGRQLLPMAGTVLTTADGAGRLGGNSIGLGPWQTHSISTPEGRTVQVTGTPAQHGPAGADRGPATGFVLESAEHPDALYISGDTVWFDGVVETLKRFPNIRTAVLFMGAARVVASPSHLTFTAEEGVRFAKAQPTAAIVPVHFEGWRHFTENKEQIARTFADAGLEHRLTWLKPAVAIVVKG